jgi:N-formylglutamate deformylase
MAASLFTLISGTTPLLIDVPHAGTYIPAELRSAMTPVAQTTPDTDWHVHLLYEFALQSGAGLMAATHSRYVVDLNRNPQSAALYRATGNTEFCPLLTFANEEIYLPGRAPSEAEIAARQEQYWDPYHRQLQAELDAIKASHGYVVLLDGHSILSRVPRFFSGALPDLNLGTVDDSSCDPALQAQVFALLQKASRFTATSNGRFKGGYITRHYGRPAQQVHALQLEIAQAAYMDEPAPYAWNPQQAQPLIAVLRGMVDMLSTWRPGA